MIRPPLVDVALCRMRLHPIGVDPNLVLFDVATAPIWGMLDLTCWHQSSGKGIKLMSAQENHEPLICGSSLLRCWSGDVRIFYEPQRLSADDGELQRRLQQLNARIRLRRPWGFPAPPTRR